MQTLTACIFLSSIATFADPPQLASSIILPNANLPNHHQSNHHRLSNHGLPNHAHQPNHRPPNNKACSLQHRTPIHTFSPIPIAFTNALSQDLNAPLQQISVSCPICDVAATRPCLCCDENFCNVHLYSCPDCNIECCSDCFDSHIAEGHWSDSDTAAELTSTHLIDRADRQHASHIRLRTTPLATTAYSSDLKPFSAPGIGYAFANFSTTANSIAANTETPSSVSKPSITLPTTHAAAESITVADTPAGNITATNTPPANTPPESTPAKSTPAINATAKHSTNQAFAKTTVANKAAAKANKITSKSTALKLPTIHSTGFFSKDFFNTLKSFILRFVPQLIVVPGNSHESAQTFTPLFIQELAYE